MNSRWISVYITLLMPLVTPSAGMAATFTFNTLAKMNGINGFQLQGGLVAEQGFFYGTASRGGANNNGSIYTVFKAPTGEGFIFRLASFDGLNGDLPICDLVADASGALYGTTFQGGSHNDGTVFRFTPSTGKITSLVSFTGPNGQRPQAGLVINAEGDLYGTTLQGGTNNRGTVFKIDASTHQLTTLASFDESAGSVPLADLYIDNLGNLYGTASSGGPFDKGTVFKIDGKTNELMMLAAFDGTNGEQPVAGLIADSQGHLYGTTTGRFNSNSSFGTVFKLDINTNELITLATFNGANGQHPIGDLVMTPDGNIYGTTNIGGSDNKGTIFEIAAGTNVLTTIVSFTGENGANPVSGLITDAQGNLYGTTDNTIFELVRSVPEPSSFLLITVGLVAIACPCMKSVRQTR